MKRLALLNIENYLKLNDLDNAIMNLGTGYQTEEGCDVPANDLAIQPFLGFDQREMNSIEYEDFQSFLFQLSRRELTYPQKAKELYSRYNS